MDNDNIELPPLPRASFSWDQESVERYARAAILADRRAKQEAKQAAKQAAKPVVHKMRLSLMPNGVACLNTSSVQEGGQELTLRWTADGRAWIESERNRELARNLRFLQCHESAAALDGASDD